MHSKIFQISDKPISKDEYVDPSTYYDNSGDFADYIGDEITGEDRKDALNSLYRLIKDVFRLVRPGIYAYKGEEAMKLFKQSWADGIKAMAASLNPDNLFHDQNLFKIRCLTKESHLRTGFRVHIENWAGGTANPFGELFEYADSQLKTGDRIYVGAIIDYHF